MYICIYQQYSCFFRYSYEFDMLCVCLFFNLIQDIFVCKIGVYILFHLGLKTLIFLSNPFYVFIWICILFLCFIDALLHWFCLPLVWGIEFYSQLIVRFFLNLLFWSFVEFDRWHLDDLSEIKKSQHFNLLYKQQ